MAWWIENGFLPDPSKPISAALIPILTNNIGTNGEMFYSSAHATGNGQPYYAFDNNENTGWVPRDGETGGYLGYHFSNPALVTKYKLSLAKGLNPSAVQIYIQGSNDKSNWTTLDTITATAVTAERSIQNNTRYAYYRLYSTGILAQGSTGYWSVRTLQLYGY